MLGLLQIPVRCWRMSFRNLTKLVLTAWAVLSPLQAQDAWTDFLKQRQSPFRETTPWTLLFQARDMKFAEEWFSRDVDIQEMFLGHDLALEPVPSAAAKARWGASRFTLPWTLLDPKGQENSESRQGIPDLLATFQKAGYIPSWEARRAFLKQHPGNGEAWQAEVGFALRGAERRLNPRLLKEPGASFRSKGGRQEDQEARADEFFQPLTEALGHFAKVPEWWRASEWMSWLPRLERVDAAFSPKLRSVLEGMHQDLSEAWRRSPHSGSADLGKAWISLGGLLQEWMPPLRLPKFTPLPGRVWPSPGVLFEYTSARCGHKRWDDLLAQLEDLPQSENFRADTEDGWTEYCNLRAGCSLVKAIATAGLGRWEETLQALEEARRWAGPSWMEADAWDGYLGLLESASPALYRERGEDLGRILNGPVLPRPLPPTLPAPVRLVLFGKPAWRPQWDALRQDPGLVRWDATELLWDAASAPDPALVARMNWTQAPRWILFQGASVLASDTVAPEAKYLLLLLDRNSPSKLRRLERLLQREPDNLDVHRARVHLLLPRMPQSDLESDLADSARIARVPVPLGKDTLWKPDPMLWGSHAKRLLPEIQDLLLCWPSSVEAWRLYGTWQGFQPAMPSLASFPQTLEVWDSRSRWAARLPEGIHEMLRADFVRTKQFVLMREWFLMAQRGITSWPDPSQNPEQRRDQAAVIASGLREALMALHYDDELQAFLEQPPLP